MRCITIRHPWAHAIVYLGKDVENRSVPWMWHAAVGERIAVHAGARLSARGVASELVQEAWSERYPFQLMIPNLRTSAVIGTVHVAGIHPASECGGCSPWAEQAEGTHHLVLTDPEACEPVRLPGKLGLWHLPSAAAESIKPHSGDFLLRSASRNAGHNDRGADRIEAC